VTHDRYLLDRVTNAVLGLDGLGNAVLFADYLQWEAWRDQQTRAGSEPAPEEVTPTIAAISSASQPRRKLSYMEQREYDTLETALTKRTRGFAPPSSASRLPKLLSIQAPSSRPSPNSKPQKPSTTPSTSDGWN